MGDGSVSKLKIWVILDVLPCGFRHREDFVSINLANEAVEDFYFLYPVSVFILHSFMD